MRTLAAILAVVAGLAGSCRGAAVTDAGPPKTKDKTVMSGNGTLRDVVDNAIQKPTEYAGLELDYARGHDLSGVTHFHVNAAGAYTLSSRVTRDEQEHSWSGTLDAADRDALLRAMRDSALLDVPSSTRNMADDEEPILVTVSYQELVHELEVWHDDAGPSGFHRFEEHVVALTKKLSGGVILTIPAR
ncbi:MAG TPA: hypothetical protein VM261_17800 [Kofleriaceae bacterium]|nr:hypothetical protein [Kofleriaceae bacterium]